MQISKTKIDQLGDRLRKGNITDDDLRLLDEYRRSFSGAYEVIVGTIRDSLGLEPTGRPAKSTTSISDKLRRESIRLTQIQDIAGCRIVVPEYAEQEQVVPAITKLFLQSTVIDRRQKPSYGYRAVHVVVVVEQRNVEIQVRTSFQQLWAEASEKLSDFLGSAIKYGGGAHETQAELLTLSNAIAKFEGAEYRLLDAKRKLDVWLSGAALTEEEHAAIIMKQQELNSIEAQLRAMRADILDDFRQAIDNLQE